MNGNLSVGVPDVLVAGGQWATYASTFADVTPPEIASVWPSAVAVRAIHGEVAASHAQFGTRVAQTAAAAQFAGTSFAVQDVEQNTQAMSNLISDAAES